MTTWNYRILRGPSEPDEDGNSSPIFTVIEVYYDDDETITGFCPAEPQGETPEELAVDLTHMLAAFVLPVLRWDAEAERLVPVPTPAALTEEDRDG